MQLTRKVSLALVFFAMSAAAPSAHAQTYDAAGDFSAVSNPNGVWSYGYEATLGSTFNRSTLLLSPTPDIKGWFVSNSSASPAVGKNFGATTASVSALAVNPGQLFLFPGGNLSSVVRFTAPSNGLYTLSGGFTPATFNGTTADVHVFQNGTSLFNGLVTGTYNAPTSAPNFSMPLNLKAGDTLDFAVHSDSFSQFFANSAGLSATLTPAPEASTTVSFGLLLCLGLGGWAWSARRRKGQAAE